MTTKGSFSSVDIFQVVQELNKSVVKHRINNFYDIGPKTFVMRFGAADSKHRIVFEPGLRCHATELDHEKPKIPSHFTLLVRKNIRGWRLRSVSQVGRDRVVDFGFGGTQDQPPQFHMFVELWGQGNIILTDASTKIVAMWRTMKTAAAAPTTATAPVSSTNKTNNNNSKTASATTATTTAAATTMAISSGSTNKQVGDLYLSPSDPAPSFTKVTKDSLLQIFIKSATENSPMSLNSLLPSPIYGIQLIKHINLTAAPAVDFSKSLPKILAASKIIGGGGGGDGAADLSEQVKSYLSDLAEKIAAGFDEVDQAYGLFSSSSSPSSEGAFAFSSKSADQTNSNYSTSSSSSSSSSSSYLGFAKIPLKQFTSQPNNFIVTPTSSFSAAADLLFSAEERKKLADIAKKQPTAQSREERVRAAIQRRIVELENEGAQRRKCANALLLASDEVDKVVTLLSDALALGTPWKTLTEAIKRQREAAAEEEEKKRKKKFGEDDDDDDDDKIDLGSSSSGDDEDTDEENDGADLFIDEDDDDDDDDNSDENNSNSSSRKNGGGDDKDSDDDDDMNQEESAKARAADEQRYLLSLIYALDLRKNQLTLQLPDPDHSFDVNDEFEQNNNNDDDDFDDRFAGGPKIVLVVVDIGLTAHENAAKYFELAKKADQSKSKTEDKEEEAVKNAKKAGKKDANQQKNKKNNNNNEEGGGGNKKNSNEANKKKGQASAIPKLRDASGERQPAWFERHFWFITSVGDLVIMPKDAGQADVLIQKFTNRTQDVVVMVDEYGAWPTIVKPRAALVAAAAVAKTTNNGDSSDSSTSTTTTYTISNTSLLEAAAATLCRSNVGNGWTSTKAAATAQLKQQKKDSKQPAVGGSGKQQQEVSAPSSSGSSSCFWCPAACLTKAPEKGSGVKQLPQGAWAVMNPQEFKKPLQLAFSSQLCVALVESVVVTTDEGGNNNNRDDSFFSSNSSGGGESGADKIKSFNITALAKKCEETCGAPLLTNAPSNSTTNNNTDDGAATSPLSNSKNNSASQQQQQLEQQLSGQALKHQQKKAKLIQKKYGEQDDEDRAIALALIGTKKSKAQEMLERDDQLPTAGPDPTAALLKKDKKSKKSSEKNKNDEDDDHDDKNANAENVDDEKKQSSTKEQASTEASKTAAQQQQQPRQPRLMSDDSQKNLQEKIQTAATEFLTMRYIDSSAPHILSSSSKTTTTTTTTRYLVPVLVPLLTMPMNKCRVLLVPGSEKRPDLAKELQKSFFAPLAEHLSKQKQTATPAATTNDTNDEEQQQQQSSSRFSNFPALVNQMTNDDTLLQLPMTGKIQTPFRASLVQL